MATNIFVINLDKCEQRSLADLNKLTPSELISLADKIITPQQFCEMINSEIYAIDGENYSPEEFYFVSKDVADEEIHVTMGEDDWQEIIINKELHLHITCSEGNYNFDYYRWFEGMDMDEDHDFDSDYIKSTSINGMDDLATTYTVEVQALDGTDAEWENTDFSVRGGKIFREDDEIGKYTGENDLSELIVEAVSGRGQVVTSITNDNTDEVIYDNEDEVG